MRYIDSPISPSTILWLNFIMDTMAGVIFGTEIPDKNKPRINPKPDENDGQESLRQNKPWTSYRSLLDDSKPNSANDSLFTFDMKFTLVCVTIYQ